MGNTVEVFVKKYSRTIAETTTYFLGDSLLMYWLNRDRMVYGNRSDTLPLPGVKFFRDWEDSHPFLRVIMDGLASVGEEVMFRDSFAKLAKLRDREMGLKVGLPSSLLFGLVHSFYIEDRRLKFSFPTLLGFSISGLYLWYLYRSRGLDHAMLSHTTFNLIASATE